MAYPVDRPFPQRAHPALEIKIGAQAIDDYVKIFERRRRERPGGRFVDADIHEIMRMAEHLGKVTRFEISYINKQLLRERESYFRAEAQKTRLRILVHNHLLRNAASKDDEFVRSVLNIPPMPYFRDAEAAALVQTAQDLSTKIKESREYYAEHASDDPKLIAEVNVLSNKLAGYIEGLTLSDVDKGAKEKRKAWLRDLYNFNRVLLGGEPDHEAKWNANEKKWKNWNRDIVIHPGAYKNPTNLAALQDLIRRNRNEPIRIVAGGHAFNTSSDTGGTESQGVGLLITLDNYALVGNRKWKKVRASEAVASYKVSSDQAKRVVRVSAGMRLREFTEAMFTKEWALSVAGSTDAQSIGGLIATDLHSTGQVAGFLSQQLLEVLTLDANGKAHRFVKNDGTGVSADQRWEWQLPDGTSKTYSKLAVAGALGMTGVVAEAVIKLDKAFNFEKNEQYVPRKWAESQITNILNSHPHVSFYYAGGKGHTIKTVRLNTWKRTHKAPSRKALDVKRERELLDHAGSGFLPNFLLNLSSKDAATPGTNEKSDWLIQQFNAHDRQVLQANHAFARKLYFQHDEIEVGIPLGTPPDYSIFPEAIKETQKLLKAEEFNTVIEIRFTPDASEAMLGPGTGGPTCYVELAPSMQQYSRERIVQVFHRFDTMMRNQFKARPHLGKKTSATAAVLKKLHGKKVWDDFNDVRKTIDPDGKFRPHGNELLKRLFP